MTHFRTDLRVPLREDPSPMEDAIVQQVEWYMGRLNLEKDEYLKDQMDDELWVSLDVILNFPKMQRMGVQDKRRVATLLHARSTVVEVDEKSARIRPAWARRSTIVIHDVPASARLDQVAALLHIPSTADLSKNLVPPTVSHPPGLISLQPAADTIWLAIFDSPSGAHDSLHLLANKDINGQKVNPEVHVETALRSSEPYRQSDGQPQSNVYPNPRALDSAQSNSAQYAPVTPIISTGMMTNQMLNSIGMPMPVMPHPSQDPHQYPYGPPTATYAPGYAPQNIGVPRQFIAPPRGIPPGYMITYPQGGHAYDPSHAVPISGHPMRPHQQTQQQQQQQVPSDQNGAPIMGATPISAENSTTVSSAQSVPNGAPSAPAPVHTVENAENGAEYAQGAGIGQGQADAQRIAPPQIPYAGSVQIPVIPGQPIEGQMIIPGQVKPIDMHYIHPAQIVGDPTAYGRGNGRQQGMGRDRNGQRGGDGNMRSGGRGALMDGQRGSSTHRKGKKGNRGSTRHGHGHDRERRDGKGDGSGSDSGNRDDRRFEKPKPEPNLASMHFPPLPMSDTAGPKPMPAKITGKKEDSTDNSSPIASSSELKEVKEVLSPDESHGDTPPKMEQTQTEATPNDADMSNSASVDDGRKDAPSQEPLDSRLLQGELAFNQIDSPNREATEPMEASPKGDAEKKAEPKPPTAPPAVSPMSYAAILRSKKPGPPPRTTPPTVSRSSSGASGKNSEGASGSETNPSSQHPPKEKSGRGKKSNSQRNSHTGDGKESNSSSTGKSGKNVEKQGSDTLSSADSKNPSAAGSESNRSKPAVENTRAHPVWVNKPKSLFQAASAAPTVRPSTPQIPIDSKKVSSPVSSQGDEKETAAEKAAKASVDHNTLNGKPNGALSPGSVGERNHDNSGINGALETKDATELPKSKAVNPASKSSGDGNKNGKGSKSVDKTGSVPAKGAWAAGGPRTWPKTSGNGVMEKVNNTAES